MNLIIIIFVLLVVAIVLVSGVEEEVSSYDKFYRYNLRKNEN